MRKLLFILFTSCSMVCSAQSFFDMWQQGQQQAFDAGARDAALYMAKQNIADGNYDAAYNKLEEIADKSSEAAGLLGSCYELGMGTIVDRQLAKYYYSKGGSYGRGALNRINSDGYWDATEENCRAFSNMVRMQMNAQYGGGFNNGYNSSGGSSSSSGRTCAGCRGTGNCTMCHGHGGYYHDTGTYTGNPGQTWTTCPGCGGNGKCKVCYGKGSIR